MTVSINNLFSTSKNRQTGVATTVFIILVGLALTATGTGVINSVQSNQHKQIAINAVTHAQTGVWVGAEAFRLYLSSLDGAAISGLDGNLGLGLAAKYGNVQAKDISVTDSGGVYAVSANITNKHTVAQASAQLNVVYEVDRSATSGSIPPAPAATAVNFNDDLNLEGALNLQGEDNEAFNLTVNGNVALEHANANTLGTIRAIGKVTLGSNVSVERIFANDDVTLANTSVHTVWTRGKFVATGSASVGELRANGDVDIDGSGVFTTVHTLGSAEFRGGGSAGHGLINARESITLYQGPVENLEAKGNVYHNQHTRMGTVITEGDITCVSPYYEDYTSLSANGTLNNCTSAVSVTTESGATNTVTNMEEVDLLTFTETVVDVWTLKSEANYIIETDDQDRIKVTVYYVTGIPNGSEYFIGNYNLDDVDYIHYLCETVDVNGECLTPSEPLMPLCIGDSVGSANGCLDYDPDTNTFLLLPNTSAPGIMWFDGNLELGRGNGITTYLATGNIKTSNGYKSSSANFGGYSKVCLADNDHVEAPGDQAGVEARYTAEFEVNYPSNLCDRSNADYRPNSTGNIALAAGGTDPDGDGGYSGGNIEIGSQSIINGAVLAGNVLTTRGNTTINGIVAATGNGTDLEEEDNDLRGTTTINLNTGTADFDPLVVPQMSGNTDGDADSDAGGAISTNDFPARMLWVRYR